jgi:hypothetical protein
MIFQFDHRYNSHNSEHTSEVEHQDAIFVPLPRYWIEESRTRDSAANLPQQNWFITFRDRARSTDMRTAIFAVVPLSGITHPLPIISSPLFNTSLSCIALANFNCFVFDYVIRRKLSGYHLSFYLIKQQPVIPPSRYSSSELQFIKPRVLELTYTAWDLQSFAQDCGYIGPPFRWDEERRFLLRCELDAAYFHLYDIERDDVAYIMDTFPIVRRKDEAAHGEYRTKRVILEIYDEMAAGMQRSRGAEEQGGYQTRLEPPPAHPDAAHAWDEAYLGPELAREAWWREGQGSGGAEEWAAGGSVWEKVRDAELELLIHAALRFNAYDYMEETGYDGQTAAKRFIESGDLPTDPLQQMSIMFVMQRATKNGYQALNGPVYRAMRALFPIVCRYDVPEAYRYQDSYSKWVRDYAPQVSAWADFIEQIHQRMPYDDEASVFAEPDLTAVYQNLVVPEVESGGAEEQGGRGAEERKSEGITTTIHEPGPVLELKPPPAPPPKSKAKPTPPLSVQPSLISDFVPPQGSRRQRLRMVMDLGQPQNQAELQMLVGALADEDDSIRWLAGSSLTRLGGLAVVNMLAAFLGSTPGATAEQEAMKVLGLIGDTDEDTAVREAAQALVNK